MMEKVEEQSKKVSEVQDSEDLSLVSVFGGHRLHPTTWKPTDTALALVYVCHGVGEYMGRYEELATELLQNGLLVFGHDHVGHGRSEGDRVHVEDVDTYVQDAIRHVELMKNKYPHLPCILMGHSMGGLIAGHIAIQRSELFTSVILSAAAAEYDGKFSIWIVNKMLHLLGHVAPHVGVKSLNPNDISSIPKEVERYESDPLVWHGSMKARWAVAMVDSITLLRENVGRISLPLLLIHGSEDHLVPITSSHFINDNASSQDKKFEVFEGSRHETLHDKEQERVIDLIKNWVLAHLTAYPEHISDEALSTPKQETAETSAEQAVEGKPDIDPVAVPEEKPKAMSSCASEESTHGDT